MAFIDGLWSLVAGILRAFWRFTKGLVRTLMPGQPALVHTVVAAAVVVAELAAVVYVLRDFTYGS